MPRKSRSPFEPFATVVGLGASLCLASVIAAAFGWGHFYGLGEQTICVRTDHHVYGAPEVPASFRPGVAVTPVAVSLCTNHATLGQQVLNVLTELPTVVFYGAALLLLWWLLSGAKVNGPFNAVNGRRVRFLGWWLVLGGIAVSSVQTLATNLLAGTMMVSSAAPSWWRQLPGLPMSTILTGLGLIVVARILQAGTRMQDDLAGTV
jgi:hypothetical protein